MENKEHQKWQDPNNQSNNNRSMAGVHTFNADQNKVPAQDPYFQDKRKYFTPKMLNHADDVGNMLFWGILGMYLMMMFVLFLLLIIIHRN